MEEEEKKEAIEKTGVDYDKLKEIISTVYPVRYERRTAIAPVLWICGAMFTTSLIWCTVNMGLTNDSDYKTTVMWFALSVAGLSFAAALYVVYKCLTWKKRKSKGKGKDEDKNKGKDEDKNKGKDKDEYEDEYEPCWDLLRSEHFLLEMQRLTNPKSGSKEDSGLVGNNHASTEEKNKLQCKDGKESNKKD